MPALRISPISAAAITVALVAGATLPLAGESCQFGGSGLPAIGESAVASAIEVHGVAALDGLEIVLDDLAETVVGVEELDVLIVGPAGDEVILLAFACIETTGPLDLVFSPVAASPLPSADYESGAPCASGAWLPGDYADLGGGYLLKSNPPAPAPPYPATLADLLAADPNGTWTLYAAAFSDLDDASLGGWSLRFDAGACGGLPPEIFVDGFESGSECVWSTASGGAGCS